MNIFFIDASSLLFSCQSIILHYSLFSMYLNDTRALIVPLAILKSNLLLHSKLFRLVAKSRGNNTTGIMVLSWYWDHMDFKIPIWCFVLFFDFYFFFLFFPALVTILKNRLALQVIGRNENIQHMIQFHCLLAVNIMYNRVFTLYFFLVIIHTK